MSKYTLHYFAGNGRAIIPRAILCYAKADWTNHTFDRNEWAKIKKSGLCEFEQVPVLEVDGRKYAQSHAISLYLGETFNLLGKDKEENYQINNLLLAIDDFNMEVWKTFFAKNEDEKRKIIKAALEKFKFFIGKFEKRYIDHGKGKFSLIHLIFYLKKKNHHFYQNYPIFH